MTTTKKTAADRSAIIIGELIGAIANWPLGALYLMLFVGDVHLDWWRAVPTLPWDSALWLGLLLAGFVKTASYRPSRDKS